MDPLIQHLQVQSTAGFDLRGTPKAVTQYSYYVGTHGPFTDQYDKDADTPDVVQAGFQKRINHLRAVGAIQ